MAVCPKCGLPFSYSDVHVCEGRDKAKLWLFATVAIGSIVGAILGGRLGLVYVNSVIRQACDKSGATNLCGLPIAPAVPFYVAAGAVIGASAAACAVVLIFRARKP